MEKAVEMEVSGSGKLRKKFFRCVGLEAEAAVYLRMKAVAGQSPEQAAIEDQSNVIDGEVVEDIDPLDTNLPDKI